jgi:hypothetical protein
MREIYTALYPNEQVATKVAEYATQHSTPLPQHIIDHQVWGIGNVEKSNYMISSFQSQFHVWMAKAMGAKRSECLI